ncbi:hypothetical protein [Sphingomonas oligophenolica]|uniref:PepSY domain-containing protein n=1 Tax=Sphingomonas oligophenolica TaxID=301154 RepID=A0A502CS36_9SPHN|nr:hypothetical protein [Sphingomonas oligophenolica]TPG15542.1 hypothetical protein EAH84_01715 [Sphingomonas oligophenolica]
MMMLSALLILAAPAGGVEPDQRRSEQVRAYEATKEGRILSPRIVESRVIPTMKDYQYLGFDLDFGSGIYTLKFLRDGTVVWVEVDGRSGQVLGRTGN